MSIGKKIYMMLYFGIYAIIDLACLRYIVDGLFFKLGFEDVFSSINKDVEEFLKEKAIQSTKLNTSSTYLVVSSEKGCGILGYFTLATKMLTLKKEVLSKSEIRIISRFGYYDKDSNSYKIPAILIAQFSKNFNKKSKSINGSDLMDIVLKQVKNILNLTSGKVVFIECEKIEKVINFYVNSGFQILDTEIVTKNKKDFIQLYRVL